MLALVLEHESIQLLTLWSYLNALGAYMPEEVRLGVQSRKRTVSMLFSICIEIVRRKEQK